MSFLAETLKVLYEQSAIRKAAFIPPPALKQVPERWKRNSGESHYEEEFWRIPLRDFFQRDQNSAKVRTAIQELDA